MAENKNAVDEKELAALLAESQKYQEKEFSDVLTGPKVEYISLAKSGSKALKKSEKDLYIAGLSIGDFYVQSRNLNLGDTLKVIPLSFVALYQEKDFDDVGAKYFGLWSKEQANTFPLVEGSYFNRKLPNGHVLVPTDWVFVEVVGHPELENAVIPYKSTGSRIWRSWKEDAKKRSTTSATLVYVIREEVQSNERHDWTTIGFAYDSNLLETDKAMAIDCIKKSNSLRKSYEDCTLIGTHDVSALPAPAAALPEKSAKDDAEEVVF